METKKYREIAEKLFTQNPKKYMELFDAVKTLVKCGVIDKTWLDYIVTLDRRFAISHYKEFLDFIMEVMNDE